MDTAEKGFELMPGAAQAFVASVLPGRLRGTQVMQEKRMVLGTASPSAQFPVSQPWNVSAIRPAFPCSQQMHIPKAGTVLPSTTSSHL